MIRASDAKNELAHRSGGFFSCRTSHRAFVAIGVTSEVSTERARIR